MIELDRWISTAVRGRLAIFLVLPMALFVLVVSLAILVSAAEPLLFVASIWGLLTAGLAAYVITRMRQAAIRVEATGVRVRNDFKTHFFLWSEIDEFIVSPLSGMGWIRLRSGRAVRVHGLSSWNPLFIKPVRVAAFVAELNAQLARHRTDSN